MQTADVGSVPIDYPGLLSLEARGFVVAGAGQGIGQAAANALAAAGARVLCIDVVPERAQQVAEEVSGVPLSVDMNTRDGVEKALAVALESFGRIDGFVDIIGISKFTPLFDITDEDWEFTQTMNVRHAFLMAQIFGRRFAEQGVGSMVYIGSVSGMTGAQLLADYGAAKAALLSLVGSVAGELGPSGVRVNAISPGVVWTPRMSARIGEDRRADFAKDVPLGRLAVPSDIGAAALFLSSDLASYVTGQNLVLDGGNTHRLPFPFGMLV